MSSDGGAAGASPRTSATGTPAVLPLTRSAAAAISSATRARRSRSARGRRRRRRRAGRRARARRRRRARSRSARPARAGPPCRCTTTPTSAAGAAAGEPRAQTARGRRVAGRPAAAARRRRHRCWRRRRPAAAITGPGRPTRRSAGDRRAACRARRPPARSAAATASARSGRRPRSGRAPSTRPCSTPRRRRRRRSQIPCREPRRRSRAARSSPGAAPRGMPEQAAVSDDERRRGARPRRHARRSRSSAARSSAAPAIRAAAATSVISSGRAHDREPRAGAAAGVGVGGVDQPAVEEVRVQPGHRRRGRRRPRWPQAGVGVPAHRAPADQRRDPDDGRAVPRRASRTPGTPRMIPIETTGLLGGSSTTSASRIASSTPGAARRAVHADRDEPLRRHGGPHPHPPLLEVDRALAAVAVVDHHVGLDRGVAHRQQRDAAVGQPPARGQARGHLRQRHALARATALRTTWVPKSRSPRREPLRLRRRRRRARPARGGVSSARPQPCPSWMPPPRVYITVSRSGQTRSPNRVMSSPVLPMTVTWSSPARSGVAVEVGAQAAQEPGAADAAGQCRDAHGAQSLSRPPAPRPVRRARSTAERPHGSDRGRLPEPCGIDCPASTLAGSRGYQSRLDVGGMTRV